MDTSRILIMIDSDQRSKSFLLRPRLIFIILGGIILVLIIVTITLGVLLGRPKSSVPIQFAVNKGTIGFPVRLPDDGRYVQWTLLQMNDVYEMLPLDDGRKGGLARVARIRQLLMEENKQTYTVLAGDLLSPSALSQSPINGTTLNGRQMIASMNALGLDFITFGNHEFDLNETELTARMAESNFTWISSNVFQVNSDRPFASSVPYKLVTIDGVRLLIFGLSIDVDKPYVRFINQSSLVPFVQQFLVSIAEVKYDVLVALTHLGIATDIRLAENVPQIDLILGGHEHEDYYLWRGADYTPIHKADSNAFTVFIHRCAFNLDTRRFRVYSNLARVIPELQDEKKTAEVIGYWYSLGIRGFDSMGFQPNQTVARLPAGVELDGRSTSVRNFPTLLSNLSCECMLESTASNGTIIGLYNTGSIRIDDVLRGTITQYDVLRTLPFPDILFSLSVPGQLLARVLSNGMSMKGSGSFLSFCGIQTPDQGKTWFVNGTDISNSGLNYNVATIGYIRRTRLNSPIVVILHKFKVTRARSLINYLQTKYPPF
jgi:5'-nucleotidase / UDP-sugar diphosphatase